LNRRANQLGHYLRRLGVGPDARVAICAERSLEMILAVMAVLKAGGAYVPLDPTYPAARLRYMLQDSEPRVVLTQSSLKGLFAGVGEVVPVLDLGAPAAPWSDQPQTNPERAAVALSPEHLGYVIYTSGSTGQPKGVMVPHRGIVNLVCALGQYLAIHAESRVLQFASFSFDGCAFEVFVALCRGASLHVPSRGERLVGENLVRFAAQHRITHAIVPPSVLQGLPEDAGLDSIRTLVVSGEALSHALVRRWTRGRRLINGYGPTETTVGAALYECKDRDSKNPPIGRPFANVHIYILDATREPVPVGVAGELYIGGAGVARGYLNRPELTAQRFVDDPFSREAGARMYKTGDLGRWLPDGTIEFLGRNDFQVKIRGFRVELGEIEARLTDCPGVRETAVVVREDTPGDKRLVAYYTVAGTSPEAQAGFGAEHLRAHLSARLPEYMVPAAYVRLGSMPLTPNGKLDRNALPAPESAAYAMRGYQAPQGQTETAVAKIWAELLKIERVGRLDNFFELGGHSLLAVTLIERMARAGLPVGVQAVFATRTLSELAAAVGSYVAFPEAPPNRISTVAIPADLLSVGVEIRI
jgi:amino acid adenylation domain-containing protein